MPFRPSTLLRSACEDSFCLFEASHPEIDAVPRALMVISPPKIKAPLLIDRLGDLFADVAVLFTKSSKL
jgi:hypothetical protein